VSAGVQSARSRDHSRLPERLTLVTRPNSCRLVLSPLWLLVALLTTLALNASPAAASGGPETRVRAIPTTTPVAVGQHSSEIPGGVGCLRSSQPGLVSGSCVATEAVLVTGAGSGTRAINFKPNAADPNWGLTSQHLDKHLFGSGKNSLSQIDAAGSPDLWRNYIQDLAGRPATSTLKGGIEDIIGTFPKADGSGTFQFGIRISPASDGSFDLITLLTKQ
jgi:hypothetical protein